jgi:hypothetical protein
MSANAHSLSNKKQAQANDDHSPGSSPFPKWKNIHAYLAILERYDVLYLPPFWFHHVTSLGVSVSANVWSLSNEIVSYEKSLGMGLPDAFGDISKLSWISSSSFCADTFTNHKTAALMSFVRSLVRKMLEHFHHDEEKNWKRAIENYLVTQRYDPLRHQLNCDYCSVDFCPRDEDVRLYDDIVKMYADRVVSALLGGGTHKSLSSSCGCNCGRDKGKCEIMVMNYLEEVVSYFLGGPSRLCDFFSTCVLAMKMSGDNNRVEL